MARSSIRRLRDASGYSLVEVTVAMIVLSLAVIPLVGVLEAGLRAATAGGRYDGARALAGAKIEAVGALPYDSAVERYAPPGPPEGVEGPYAYSVETAFVDAELGPAGTRTGQMRIDVTVTWDGGSYTATGLVSGEPP